MSAQIFRARCHRGGLQAGWWTNPSHISQFHGDWVKGRWNSRKFSWHRWKQPGLEIIWGPLGLIVSNQTQRRAGSWSLEEKHLGNCTSEESLIHLILWVSKILAEGLLPTAPSLHWDIPTSLTEGTKNLTRDQVLSEPPATSSLPSKCNQHRYTVEQVWPPLGQIFALRHIPSATTTSLIL